MRTLRRILPRKRWYLLLLATLWHIPLWFLYNAQPYDVRAVEPAMRGITLSFLALPPEPGSAITESDARILWSPVLFSLPSPVGFSKPLTPQSSLMIVTEEMHSEPGIMLKESLLSGRGLRVATPDSLDMEVRQLLGRREIPRSTQLFKQTEFETARGMSIIMSTELEGRSIANTKLDPDMLPQIDQPWQAVAHISFAAEGWPAFVILESATQNEELDRALIRWLHGWRFDELSEPPEGRVEILFQP